MSPEQAFRPDRDWCLAKLRDVYGVDWSWDDPEWVEEMVEALMDRPGFLDPEKAVRRG